MTESSPTLADRFGALHAERERSWPADRLRANVAQRRALVERFDPARVIAVGDVVAPFTLESDAGAPIDLAGLTADGPALLLFFRFAGCPACNIALAYYEEHLRGAIERAGVRLVAVSPHLPEKGLAAIRERHALGFTVASDRGNALARRFGLAFQPPVNPPPAHGDPDWIGALTGLDSFELAMPAAVLIDACHVVRYVAVSPDWLVRPEAETILSATALAREPAPA